MCNLKIRGEWRLDEELGEILVKMSSTRECGELRGYCCEGDVQGGLPGDGGLQLELLYFVIWYYNLLQMMSGFDYEAQEEE